MERPQKITFTEMRSSGVRGLLTYCANYKLALDQDQRPDRRDYLPVLCPPRPTKITFAGMRASGVVIKRELLGLGIRFGVFGESGGGDKTKVLGLQPSAPV